MPVRSGDDVEAADRRPQDEKSVFQWSRELELLISGALVFALLQVPGALDRWFEGQSIHVAGRGWWVLFIIYYVFKLGALGLVAAIVSHFLVRGFWVAILGLRSVFPRPIDYERSGAGPMMRGFYERRLLSLEELERRADRLAASLFSFVFLYLMLLTMLILWTGMAWGIGLIVETITGRDGLATPVLFAFLAVLITAQSIVATVDRRAKKGVASETAQRRALGLMRVLHYLSLNFIYGPVFLTFSSNLSRRVVTAMQIAFMYLLVGVFVVTMFISRGIVSLDSYAWFPTDAGAHQLRAFHYEDEREKDSRSAIPSIQSAVIEGPYVRLFIPYTPRWDNPRIRALCKGVEPLRDESFAMRSREKTPPQRIQEVLDCLSKLHIVELDGKPLTNLEYVTYTRPGSGVRGRVTMIPTASLAPGRHLLRIRHVSYPGQDERRTDDFYIPFWK